MQYLGVDYHKKGSFATVVDEQGQVLKQGEVANSRAALAAFLKGIGPTEAVLEAGRTWPVMYGWLEGLVGKVTLAHPGKVRLIAAARIKTDRIDAGKLAQLLRADLIPVAYVPPPLTRGRRRRLRQRVFQVRMGTGLKNRIHALVDRYPELKPQRAKEWSDLFGKEGRTWLAELGGKLASEEADLLANDLSLLAAVERHIALSDAWVKELAKADPRARLLMTLPGFGAFLALLVALEIDDISRFGDAKKLCAYAGLVPSTYASSSYIRHGKIIKCSNKWLRWACIEAVPPACRKDAELRDLYLRMKGHKKPNVAKVAVAKRLLTLAYRLLTEGRPYLPKEEFKKKGIISPAAPMGP